MTAYKASELLRIGRRLAPINTRQRGFLETEWSEKLGGDIICGACATAALGLGALKVGILSADDIDDGEVRFIGKSAVVTESVGSPNHVGPQNGEWTQAITDIAGLDARVSCPVKGCAAWGSPLPSPVAEILQHLNDDHSWSDRRLTTWLDGLSMAPVPAPDPAPVQTP